MNELDHPSALIFVRFPRLREIRREIKARDGNFDAIIPPRVRTNCVFFFFPRRNGET